MYSWNDGLEQSVSGDHVANEEQQNISPVNDKGVKKCCRV